MKTSAALLMVAGRLTLAYVFRIVFVIWCFPDRVCYCDGGKGA